MKNEHENSVVFVTFLTVDSPSGLSAIVDFCAILVHAIPGVEPGKMILEMRGWARKVAPDFSWTPQLTKKSGLTAEDIATASPKSETLSKFIELVGDRTICVYDGALTASLLIDFYASEGKVLNNSFLDMSRKWFPSEIPHLTFKTLDAVCNYLGVAKETSSSRAYNENLRLVKAYIAGIERKSNLKANRSLDEPAPLQLLKPPFEGAEIAFVDTKTTGLCAKRDQVIEISVQIYKQGFGIVQSFTSLVRTPHSLPPEIVKLTGITDQMLINSPPIEEVLSKALAIIGRRTVAAFNSEFDTSFLQEAAARLELKFENPHFCVMAQAEKIIGRLRGGLSLKNVAEVMEIEQVGASHRAESDALLALNVAQAFWAGKRPYGVEKLELVIENEIHDYDTGRRIPKPKVEWSVECAKVLRTIDNNADCTMWTRDTHEYINVYGPGGSYGQGVICRIYKDKNPRFAALLAEGEDIGVWVEKPFKDLPYRYNLCFQAGELDDF